MRGCLSPALIAIVIGCQPAARTPAQRGWRAAFNVLASRLVAVGELEAEPEPEGVLTHRDAPLHERSSPLDGLVRLTVRADGEALLRVWVSSNGTVERQDLR